MARTFKDIQIDGKNVFALFDTGSVRSYIRKEFASPVRQRTIPFTVSLGGGTFEINESCLLNCAIEGLQFDVKAHPLEKIGTDEKGRRIDAIIGATTMEEWGFILNPRTGSIDLTVLRKREFTEF
ncbi:MAG: hypothetical protein ACE5PV_09755 [Candidatus Poribacteria bacterium]